MNIARPAGGFKIKVSDNVKAFTSDLFANHPELPKHWRAVLARLREAGHLVGESVDGNASQRVAVFQPYYDGPNIKLAWRVLGDTVTILLADL